MPVKKTAKTKTSKKSASAKSDAPVEKTAEAPVVKRRGLQRLRFKRGNKNIVEGKTVDKARADAGKRRAKPKKLPSAIGLFIQAIKLPWRHWEVFGGILLVYALLNLILIGGLTQGGDLRLLKESLNEAWTGQLGKLTTGLALFGFLVTTGTGTALNGVASAYQTMLLLLVSLALIWALRMVYAGTKIRVRDAWYNGMTPLVQFVLVMLFIGLQTVPAIFGGFMFSLLVGGGILQKPAEIAVIGLLFFLFLLWSLYMLSATVFAPYIVTLPGMAPWKAIRSSMEIVRGRRASVVLKLFFLPVGLLVTSAVIMVPLTLLLTPLAAVVYFLLTIAGILVVHSYMYALYRELIDQND